MISAELGKQLESYIQQLVDVGRYESENDLEKIGNFIAKDNPRHAYSFMRDLRGKCEALADMADSFPFVPRYEQRGFRRRVY